MNQITMRTWEIASITDISIDFWDKCCEDNLLFGDKIYKLKYVPHWEVTVESFCRYLHYHSDCFLKGDCALKDYILKYMRHMDTADNTLYTLTQAGIVLGMNPFEIVKAGLKGEFGKRQLFVRNVSLIDLIAYIRCHAGEEEKLRDRYTKALVNGEPELPLLREVMTAYSYYKEYGYVI